jgi:protein-disulfide isomerase
MAHLDRAYIKPGKLKYVVRDFPIESIHPQAAKAAEAAHCAREQNRYWEMHERLFAHQRALGAVDLPGHAQAVGLDATQFQQCLDSGRHAARVQRDRAEGQKVGVRGTPTFFLGTVDGDKVQVVRVLRGAVPFSTFKSAIDAALASAKP